MSLDAAYLRASGIRIMPAYDDDTLDQFKSTAQRVHDSYQNIEHRSETWVRSLCRTSMGQSYLHRPSGLLCFFFADNSYIVSHDNGQMSFGRFGSDKWKECGEYERIFV